MPKIIKTVLGFNHEIMRYLSPEQRIMVFDAVKEVLPPLIKTSGDFKQATEHLQEKQRLSLCAQIQPLHRLVLNAVDFQILDNLFETTEGRNYFRQLYFKSLLNNLTNHHLSTYSKFNENCVKLNQVTESYLSGQTTIEHFNTMLSSCKAQICTALDSDLLDKWEQSVKSISSLQTNQTKALGEIYGFFEKRPEDVYLRDYSTRRDFNL